jgi:hypothetical protein
MISLTAFTLSISRPPFVLPSEAQATVDGPTRGCQAALEQFGLQGSSSACARTDMMIELLQQRHDAMPSDGK